MSRNKVEAGTVVEKVNVRSSELIAAKAVEVKGRIGSKVPREYVVHFDRHDNLNYGYQFIPEIGYLYPHQIPEAVKEAAIKTYQDNSK